MESNSPGGRPDFILPDLNLPEEFTPVFIFAKRHHPCYIHPFPGK